MKALDQGSRLGVGFGVEPLMRMSVARKEIFEVEAHRYRPQAPMITGPPPPVSINPTRRRMGAR